MVYCAVVGCSSNNKIKSKNYKPDCRYFSFPKEKSVCDAWVHKCYQQHKFNTKTARICSEHFTDDDYCLKEKLLNLPHNKWKLKPEALPSVNLIKFPNHGLERKERVERRRLIKGINVQSNSEENEYVPTTSVEMTSETQSEKFISVETQTER